MAIPFSLFNGATAPTSFAIPADDKSVGFNSFAPPSGPHLGHHAGHSAVVRQPGADHRDSGQRHDIYPYQSFYGCVSLKRINIPPTIATIGDTSFKGCTSLTSLTIPASIWDRRSISHLSFRSTSSLRQTPWQW
eukprot:gene3490-4487_t